MVGRSTDAVPQPGAQIGESVHCPVSGVLFEVKETSERVDVGGQPVYTCCRACAEYFAANRGPRDRAARARAELIAGNGAHAGGTLYERAGAACREHR